MYKVFNSSSNIQKKSSFFLSHIFEQKTLLSVIFWKILKSYPKKSILRVMFFFEKKAQFLESCFWSQIAKKFNSLSHISLQKCAILWVIFKKSGFNSLSNVEKKGSILWDILFEKILNHVQKGFNSLTHFPKVNSLSQWKKKGSTLQVILKKF